VMVKGRVGPFWSRPIFLHSKKGIFKMNETEKDTKMAKAGNTTKNQSTARDLKDFEKYAYAVGKAPTLPEQLTMDSTSHLEISAMVNQKYSDEIVKRGMKAFDVEKLNSLKAKNASKYYEEGKRQIVELCSCIESLDAHTSMFTVSFLIAIGKILDDIEDQFGKKKIYMKWLRDNFGHKHLRYFQHAKQLHKMGNFARAYASLGKNRLLEFGRLKKELEKDFDEIFRSHPFDDTTVDFEGVLFKEHVDSIITYHRLKNAGVEFIEFDQAALIAGYKRKPIAVQGASNVKEYLESFDDVDEQKNQFEYYVLNKGVFPVKDFKPTRKRISITKHIADLVVYSKVNNIDDQKWIEDHKEKISNDDLVKVYQFINKLAEILEINLNQ
jgi:hypothetical protein